MTSPSFAEHLLHDDYAADRAALVAWSQAEPTIFSFDQLRSEVERRRSALLKVGAPQRIGVIVGCGAESALLILAGLLTEHSLVLLDHRSAQSRDDVARRTGAAYWFDGRADRQPNPVWLDLDTAGPVQIPDAGESVVLLTSGSTGTSKAVRLSLANLQHNVTAVAERIAELELALSDQVLSIVPNMAHSYGLSLLLLGLAAGSTVVVHSNPEFPALVGQQMEIATTSVLATVPSYLRLELATGSLLGSGMDRHLAARLFAGETLNRASWQQLVDQVPGDLYTMYGQTEHTARISIEKLDDQFEPGCVGRVLDGVEVKILPGAGGDAGEVAVRSPSVALGYVDGPLRLTNDGFLLTGDLGMLDEQNRLVLRGRTAEHFSLNGHSVWASDLEAEVLTLRGVADVQVVWLVEQGSLSFRLVSDGEISNSSIERSLKRMLRRHHIPVLVDFVAEIPYTDTGKRLRRLI